MVFSPPAASGDDPEALPALGTVRRMWAAFQARDWAAARALMKDELLANWWTSGERFAGAEAFIEAQARYPEGWTIHLLDLAQLHDGRVMSQVRVDHPPRIFFATSVFRIDNGLIASVDELWGTAELPPAWRETLPGRTRFDPQDDPRARPP